MTPTNLDDQEVWAASNHRRAGMSDTPQTYIPACGCIDCGNTIGELRAQLKENDALVYEELGKARAEMERVRELHQSILGLEGSEGMTDAKFVQWVLLALKSPDTEAITGEQE
jgi:hypothetical protein